jgi:hypothetical protein
MNLPIQKPCTMRNSSTREAVETAIDLAKTNRSATWEELADTTSKRIGTWEETERVPRSPRSVGKER